MKLKMGNSMKQLIFGLRSSVFGLRASVFGLLIFLFSASQVECTKQDKPNTKPAQEKQNTSNSSSRVSTGLKWLGLTALAVLFVLDYLKIVDQEKKIKEQKEIIERPVETIIQKQTRRNGALIYMHPTNSQVMYESHIKYIDCPNKNAFFIKRLEVGDVVNNEGQLYCTATLFLSEQTPS